MAASNVLVLIHGLLGNLDTWGNTDRLLGDALGSAWKVVKYEYESTLWGKNPSIEKISDQLDRWITKEHPDANLVLAAHSMGGLVAKEYILKKLRNSKADTLRVKALFLFAVPNNGAAIARILNHFLITKINVQIQQLQPPKVRLLGGDTKETFVEIQQRAWAARVNTTEEIVGEEGKAIIKIIAFFGRDDNVVDRKSAQWLHPDVVELNGNHESIVKPKPPDDLLVKSVVSAIIGLPRDEHPYVHGKSIPEQFINYIDPTTTFNVYYARFEQSLRQAANAAGIAVRHHVPPSGGPAGTLELLEQVLEGSQPGESVIVIPCGFKDVSADARSILTNHEGIRLIFVDQEPPDVLLKLPNVSYVGPDNYLVGSLAALAFEAHLREIKHPKTATLLSVSGPGGRYRSQGFVDTIRKCFPDRRTLDPLPISDKDRFETIRIVKSIVQNNPGAFGFFSGNDETAAAFIDVINKSSHPAKVVGCDGTQEMRALALQQKKTPLIDTVVTDLRQQAAEVVRVCKSPKHRQIRVLRPKLERYQYQTQRLIESHDMLKMWWPNGGGEWRSKFAAR